MGKILVTGGAGFIGSHTCVELLNAGYEVIILDNLINSKEASIERIKKITDKDVQFYKTDLLDYEGTLRVFSETASVTDSEGAVSDGTVSSVTAAGTVKDGSEDVGSSAFAVMLKAAVNNTAETAAEEMNFKSFMSFSFINL